MAKIGGEERILKAEEKKAELQRKESSLDYRQISAQNL